MNDGSVLVIVLEMEIHQLISKIDKAFTGGMNIDAGGHEKSNIINK